MKIKQIIPAPYKLMVLFNEWKMQRETHIWWAIHNMSWRTH
jgi:hypothetical protein